MRRTGLWSKFIAPYLKSAVDTYEKVQDEVQERLQDVRSAARAPLQLIQDLLTAHPEPKPESELEQLRRRVAELEQQLQKRLALAGNAVAALAAACRRLRTKGAP